jgi:hypothetical protein
LCSMLSPKLIHGVFVLICLYNSTDEFFFIIQDLIAPKQSSCHLRLLIEWINSSYLLLAFSIQF